MGSGIWGGGCHCYLQDRLCICEQIVVIVLDLGSIVFIYEWDLFKVKDMCLVCGQVNLLVFKGKHIFKKRNLLLFSTSKKQQRNPIEFFHNNAIHLHQFTFSWAFQQQQREQVQGHRKAFPF